VTTQKKKKKKKPKKSAEAKEAAALKAKAQEAQDVEDAESRPPVLCISRNKHWLYISSYHVGTIVAVLFPYFILKSFSGSVAPTPSRALRIFASPEYGSNDANSFTFGNHGYASSSSPTAADVQ